MKKLLSYLLVIALVLVQFMPLVNAEKGTQTNDGKITIENPVSGQTYEIYKLFDLESYDTEKNAYTYTINKTSPWFEFVNEGEGKNYVNLVASNDNKYVVTWKENADVAAFARAALTYAETNKIANQGSKTAATSGVIFENLSLGYYLVDSSLGTVVSLNTTVKEATIEEKNTPPRIDKDIVENGQNIDYNTANIGDVVNYEVEINAKKGAQKYVLTDKMSQGLTYNKDVKVYVNGEELSSTNYTHKTPGANGETFVVEFNKDYLDTIQTDTTIKVTYSATINKQAVINGEGNVNSATLRYGDSSETEPSFVRTYVLAFDLFKTDGSKELLGAEFKLYRANEENPIKFVKIEGGYRVATKEELTNAIEVIEVGTARIEGLDEGTYYLEETKAPEGYNKLTSRVPVTLVSEITGITQTTTLNNQSSAQFQYKNDDVTVINTTGSLLPSTGGMGTVLFITVGSIMVLGFGVLLVTKLRISKMEI